MKKNMTLDFVHTPILIKHLTYFFAFIIGSVGLATEAFAIFGVLIVIDTITGVVRTITIRGGDSFTSLQLTGGVISKGLVISVPLIVAWAGRGAGLDLTLVAQGILSVLILAEAYSILGNIHAIHVKRDVKEFDAVAWILGMTRNRLEHYLKTTGGDKTKDGQKDL